MRSLLVGIAIVIAGAIAHPKAALGIRARHNPTTQPAKRTTGVPEHAEQKFIQNAH